MACPQVIDWAATGAWAQAFLTALAIGAAIGVPYVAARIDSRRKRLSALKLAELACQALGANPSWAPPSTEDEGLKEAVGWWRSDVGSLLERMDATPSENIDDTEALAAFIWIAGLVRHSLRLDPEGSWLDVDQGVAILTLGPELARRASEQFETMKKRLGHRRWGGLSGGGLARSRQSFTLGA